MKRLYSLLSGVLFLFSSAELKAQACSTCSAVATVTVDLSANANSTFTVNIGRSGQCCQGSGSDACVLFLVTLNPQASQVAFYYPTGNSGNYYINCTQGPYAGNTPACVPGGNFCLTYCHAGGSATTYTISSSSALTTNGPITLRAGCTGEIIQGGLNSGAISYNSISPGAAGAYNSYLSCTTSCASTVNITPTSSTPSRIVYQACGSAVGCASGTVCDTIGVNIKPALTVAITPTAPVVCSGTSITLTATPSGGATPYTYLWSPGGQTTSTISVSTGGIYTVSVNDASASGCGAVTQTITVNTSTTPTITSANTATVCSGGTVSIPFTANVASTYTWIAASNPNVTGQSLTTQSTATLSNVLTNTTTSVQNVIYTVTPTSTGGCLGAAQTITVTVNPASTVTATPTSQTICSGNVSSIALASNVAGSFFSWTVTQTNVTGASASSGSSIAQTLTATTTSAGTAIYTITPTANSCSGSAITATVTVNPIPIMTSTNTATICSGGTASIPLTSNLASTYSWIATDNVNTTGESLTTQSTATLSNVIVNNTTSVQTVIYTVTPTSTLGSCVGTSQTVTVTINPAPSMTSASTATICSGATVSIPLTSNVASTYTWIAADNVNTSGESLTTQATATLSDAITNNSTSIQPVIYTVTPTSSSGSCVGAAQTVTVTVNPSPSATATPSSQNICSGGASSIALTSNVAGTTFAWTVSQTNVSGASASSGSNITQTLTATSTSAGTATYTITPTANGCSGTPITVAITVNPIPSATATPNSQTLCSGGVSSVALTSNVASTTFAWTVTQSNVTGASASSGTTIAQTLTATSTSPGTATYTITPTANSCSGTPITATVTVNPVPSATATPTTQSICSNNASSVALTSNVAGSTFAWTVTQTNVTGASASSGATIAQTLTATTTSAGTAIYTITPTAGGCAGAAITATVTVNPAPSVTATPTSQTICSGNAISIALTSSTGGATFAWTVTQTNVTGASASSGATIAQTLTATSTSAGTAIYTITPTAGGCSGTPITATVTVNPVPSATATPNSQSICSNNATSVALTSNVAGSTFAWTVTQTNVTGASASSGATIAQTLTATTTSAGTAIYTITPTAGGCAGTAITATVTVNPVPSATATPTSQSICSNNATSVAITSNVAGSTFAWTVTQTNVTGASASSGATIAQTLTATTTSAGTAIYTITPTAGGCAGTAITATVTVNPIPSMTSASTATICSGATVNIPLTSNVASNFTWIAADNVNTVGESLTVQSTATLNNTITNSSTSAQNVIYTVTPTSTGGSCAGTAQTVTVTVNPTPAMTSASSATICTGNTVSIPLTSNVASTYTWIAADNVNTTGESLTTQATATLSNTIINGTASVQTVIYTVTPTSIGGSCPGIAQTVTVNVNPVPTAIATPSSQTICSGNATSIALTSNIAGTTYSWVDSQSGITGASASSGSTIAQTLTTIGASPGTATYTITPVNGCTGASIVVTVSVNPIPSMTSANAATICSGGTVSIPLTSNLPSTYTWIAADNVNTVGESLTTQSTTTLSNTITNSGGGSQNVIYTVTPTSTSGSCAGIAQTVTVTVTVDPTPTMTSPNTATICSGATVNIPFTSAVPSTYVWIATDNVNTTGESLTTQATATLSNTIINSTTSSQNVIYTITPTSTTGGCVGAAQTITVTVNPTPVMTSASSATICTGNTVSIPLTSNIGSTYTWIAADNINTNGESLTTQATATLSNTIINGTTSVQTVIYTVTPTSTGGSCVGTAQTVTVSVNPVPTATATPSSQTICSGGATSIALTSNIAGTTYSWVISQSGITGAAAGAGANITQTLTTTGTSPGTATYTITPVNGCTGAAIVATVTVNPKPVMTSANTATICSGATVSIPLTSNVASNFTWIATDNVNTTGESITTQSTSTLSDAITNNVTSVQAVIYTVTPTSTGGSCAGVAQTVTVTVNPTPAVTSTNTATICSGGTISIPLTSNVASNFTWIAADNLNTIGESLTIQSTATLSNTITNSSASSQNVIYTVTPTSTGGSCAGTAQTVTVTVNPKPTMTSAGTATICSGATVSIPLTSNVASNFTWIATNNPNTTGESTTTQSTNTLSDAITNNTTSIQTVVYTVTPTSTGGSCLGTAQTVSVTVNPTPAMISASSATICTGNTVSIPLTSNIGSTFTWIAADNVNTTGESLTTQATSTLSNTIINGTASAQNVIYTVTPTSTGGSCVGALQTVTVTVNPVPAMTSANTATICSGGTVSIPLTSNVASNYTWIAADNVNTVGESLTIQATATLSNTITNSSTSSQNVIYTVTPTSTGGSCAGTAQTVTVTVNPKPAMTSASTETICSGATVSIPLTSNVASNFTWIATDNVNTTGESTTIQSTSTLSDAITNNVTSVQTVIYTVTPTSTSGSCVGASQTVTVTVNPDPFVTATPTSQTICSGTATSVTLTSTVGGTTFSWTVSQSGTSGASNSSGSSITQTLTTTGASAGTTTYTITPSAGACPGMATTVTITVNPTPSATATPSTQIICAGDTTSIALTSAVGGTTFSWTVSKTGVSGATAASGSSIAQTLTTTSGSPGTATYTITPVASSCAGAAIVATVTVNPTPTMTSASSATICTDATVNIPLTSNVASTYTWIATDNINTTGESTTSQTTNTLSNTIINGTSGQEFVIYTVTPSNSGGCPGTPQTVTVTVNPVPTATATPSSQSFCSGGATSIVLTSNIPGTTYSWAVSQSGVTGASNGAGANITQTLTATGASPGTATYTITPVNGCTGAAIVDTVTVNPIPAAPIAGSNSPICLGSTLNLTANNTGTTYDWSGPNTFTSSTQNPSIPGVTSAEAGIYSVTATTAGCTSPTATVNVVIDNPATVNAGSDQTVCGNNASVVLSGTSSTGTGQWTTSGSGTFAPDSTALTGTYTPSGTDITAGIVTFTLTSTGSGGCPAVTSQMTVTITPAPTVSTAPNQTVCANNADVSLNGTFTVASGVIWTTSGSGTFTPDNITATATYSPSNADITAGTVTVTITTTGNGSCLAVTHSMAITITPAPVVNAGSNISVCVNNPNAALNGTSSTGSGQWSTSGTGTFSPTNTTLNATYISSAADTSSGSVTLTLTSGNNGNCIAVTQTITVTYTPPPTVTAGTNQTVCSNNATVTLNGTSSTASGIWTTSGSGTFTPNNNTLNASYTPSAADATAGSVTFTLTSTNNGGCIPVTDQLTVTITPGPAANAGPNQSVCGNNANVTLSGTFTVSSGAIWTTLGTGTFSPDNITMNTTYIPSAADTTAGNVTIILTTTGNGTCNAATDTMIVTITNAPKVSAGTNANVCLGSPNYTLNGSSSTGSGIWTTLGAGTFSPNNSTLNATYVPSTADTSSHTVTLVFTSANNGGCSAVTDTMIIVYTNIPTVNTGSNQTVCGNNATVTLSGATSTGTGTWASSGTGTFTPNNSALNGTYLPSAADTSSGNVILTLTATGGCIPVSQNITITITDAPGVNANVNQVVCANNANVTLNGSISGGATGGMWTTSGTGTFTPDNITMNASYTPSSADTAAGSVNIILTSTGNGICNAATDTMIITYTKPPVAFAGNDATVCANNATALGGVITGGSGNGIWTTPNGSGTFSPNNVTLNSSYNTVNADTAVTSVLLILTSANNGGCFASSDTVLITVNPGPTVNAGTDQSICSNNPAVTLNGTVTHASGGQWSSLGTGTFTPNNTTLNANYTPSAADVTAGSVSLVLTSTGNGLCQPLTDTMIITFTPKPVVNAGTDISICNTSTSASLNGSVSGGTTTGHWTTLGSGTFTPNDSTLNGTYNLSTADSTAGTVTLVLTSSNNGGCLAVTDTVKINLNAVPSALAGNDTTVCGNAGAMQLNGTILGATVAHWTTNGNGVFAPTDSTLNGTYTPGSSDLSVGSVTITLTTNPNGQCPVAKDSLVITFIPSPIVNAGVNIPICGGVMTAQLNGSVSGSTTTGQWTTSGTGTLAPTDSTLNATYNLSSADSLAGTVTLVLTSTHNGNCPASTDTVLILLNSVSVTSAGNDTSICSNTTSIQLNGSVTGGSGAGQWTSSGTGTFTPNDSTLNATYTFSGADISSGVVTFTLSSIGNGTCPQSIDSMKITISPAPIVNAGSNIIICNAMSTSLNGTVSGGTTTGQWSTLGSGTFAPNNSTLNATYNLSTADSLAALTGSVTLVLTSTNNGNCSASTDTVLITLNSNAVTSAGNDTTVCRSVTSIQLNGNVYGGSPTGQWTTSGTGTFTPNNTTLNASYQPSSADTTAGSIILILTSTNNCVNTPDTMKITFDSTSVAHAGTNQTVCAGSVINLNGSITAATVGHWSTTGTGTFTPNDSTLNATYTPSGIDNDTLTFILTTSGNNACGAAKDTVVIFRGRQPNAMFFTNKTCLGGVTSFADSSNGATINSWYWTFGNGDTSIVPNPNYTYAVSGTYTVSLVVSSGTNCKDTMVKTITVNPLPTTSFTFTANCLSDSVKFTDNSTVSSGSITGWNWTFGDGNNSTAQNPHHLYDSIATYTVNLTAFSDSGCSATATQTVGISPSPLAGFTSVSNCLSLLVNFTDTSKVSSGTITNYNWTFGDGGTSSAPSPVYTYSTSGTYTVLLQVKSNNGCTDTATKVVTTGQPVSADYIPAGGNYNVSQQINFTNQSSGATTYTWTFGDNNTSTVTDPSHAFTLPGTYIVTLISANSLGCSDTSKHEFTINPNGYAVPTGFTPNGDGLNDYFYIRGGPFSEYELRVFNEWGQQIFMSNSQSEKWDGSFNGVLQPAGTYMYIFIGAEDTKSMKLSGEINIIR